MFAVYIQVRRRILIEYIIGLVFLLSLPIIAELILLFSATQERHPLAYLRFLFWIAAYIIALAVIIQLRDLIRINRMILKVDGIHVIHETATILWEEVDTIQQDRGSYGITVKLRNGQDIKFDRVAIRNYDEVRDFLASVMPIEDQEA